MVTVLFPTFKILTVLSGAASDKVTALEKAGTIVSDSPAKIGSLILKVCLHSGDTGFLLMMFRPCKMQGLRSILM